MKFISFLSLLAFPLLTYAAPKPTDFKSFVALLLGLIGYMVPLVIGLTFLVLMWGIMKAWILGGGDEESVTSGKKLVVVGVFAIAIMLGIWGILQILRRSFFGV